MFEQSVGFQISPNNAIVAAELAGKLAWTRSHGKASMMAET